MPSRRQLRIYGQEIRVYRPLDPVDESPLAVVAAWGSYQGVPEATYVVLPRRGDRVEPKVARAIHAAIQDGRAAVPLPDGSLLCGPASRFEPMSAEWGLLVEAALPAYGLRADLYNFPRPEARRR